MKILVVGINGKMGQEIISAAAKLSSCQVIGGLSTQDDMHHPLWQQADVVLDFTNHMGTMSRLVDYQYHKLPVVIGSTGFTDQDMITLKNLAQELPIFFSPNMSIGANMAATLAAKASKELKDFAVDIIEMHHTAKKDAPSGTALMIGRGLAIEPSYHVIRAGDIIGEHQILFTGHGEQLTITHRATNRSIFAYGALQAALWLCKQSVGFYNFSHMLEG